MKPRSSSVGALHPILFVAVMYVVVLFLSIFICSSIFYTLNDDSVSGAGNTSQAAVQKKATPAHLATAVVVR